MKISRPPRARPTFTPTTAGPDHGPSVEEVLTQGMDLLFAIEQAAKQPWFKTLPASGRSFIRSVESRARGIVDTVDQRDRATPAQAKALANMSRGVYRWLENHR